MRAPNRRAVLRGGVALSALASGVLAAPHVNAQGGKPSVCFSHRKPSGPKRWHRRARRRNRIDHIGSVGLHIDEGVPEVGSQSCIVCGHHGITKLDIHGKEGSLIQVSHERRGAVAGCTGEAVSPRNDGPTAGGRRLVRRKHHAGRGHIHAAGRARVIENAKCRYSLRKLILVELFRPDQLTWLACWERAGSRIEVCKGQEPAKLGTVRLGFSLALSRFGEGCNRRKVRRATDRDTNQGDRPTKPTAMRQWFPHTPPSSPSTSRPGWRKCRPTQVQAFQAIIVPRTTGK